MLKTLKEFGENPSFFGSVLGKTYIMNLHKMRFIISTFVPRFWFPFKFYSNGRFQTSGCGIS